MVFFNIVKCLLFTLQIYYFFLILQVFHTQVSSIITYSLTDRDSHKTWLWVGIVLFFQQPRDIEKEGKKSYFT